MIVRVFGALALGALATYFFDPVSGKRRRDLLRDRMNARGLRKRTQGFVAEARGMVERRMGQRRQPGSQVDIEA